MPKSLKIMPWCAAAIAVVLTLIMSTTAVAQTPPCLATGQVVNGDTPGLDVQPCPQPTAINDFPVADTTLDPLPDPPPGSFSTLYWGYEAAFFDARLLEYNAVAGNPNLASCVPSGPDIPAMSNGRGVAFDPLDGNLWISRLTSFTGDARITKVAAPLPPMMAPTPCTEISSLLVHFSDGSAPQQTGFGALDIDDSKHIWAAGYIPVLINGGLRNYFYQVNRNNGLIIHSCFIPARAPFDDGNDSLTFARLPGLPGSGRYLITDNGEFLPSDTPWLVIDVADCHDGLLVTPVATTPAPRGTTGMDFEWFGMLDTNLFMSFMDGNYPFTGPATLLGPTGAPAGLEDIAVCGFRAKFGGDGADFCPFTP